MPDKKSKTPQKVNQNPDTWSVVLLQPKEHMVGLRASPQPFVVTNIQPFTYLLLVLLPLVSFAVFEYLLT